MSQAVFEADLWQFRVNGHSLADANFSAKLSVEPDLSFDVSVADGFGTVRFHLYLPVAHITWIRTSRSRGRLQVVVPTYYHDVYAGMSTQYPSAPFRHLVDEVGLPVVAKPDEVAITLYTQSERIGTFAREIAPLIVELQKQLMEQDLLLAAAAAKETADAAAAAPRAAGEAEEAGAEAGATGADTLLTDEATNGNGADRLNEGAIPRTDKTRGSDRGDDAAAAPAAAVDSTGGPPTGIGVRMGHPSHGCRPRPLQAFAGDHRAQVTASSMRARSGASLSLRPCRTPKTGGAASSGGCDSSGSLSASARRTEPSVASSAASWSCGRSCSGGGGRDTSTDNIFGQAGVVHGEVSTGAISERKRPSGKVDVAEASIMGGAGDVVDDDDDDDDGDAAYITGADTQGEEDDAFVQPRSATDVHTSAADSAFAIPNLRTPDATAAVLVSDSASPRGCGTVTSHALASAGAVASGDLKPRLSCLSVCRTGDGDGFADKDGNASTLIAKERAVATRAATALAAPSPDIPRRRSRTAITDQTGADAAEGRRRGTHADLAGASDLTHGPCAERPTTAAAIRLCDQDSSLPARTDAADDVSTAVSHRSRNDRREVASSRTLRRTVVSHPNDAAADTSAISALLGVDRKAGLSTHIAKSRDAVNLPPSPIVDSQHASFNDGGNDGAVPSSTSRGALPTRPPQLKLILTPPPATPTEPTTTHAGLSAANDDDDTSLRHIVGRPASHEQQQQQQQRQQRTTRPKNVSVPPPPTTTGLPTGSFASIFSTARPSLAEAPAVTKAPPPTNEDNFFNFGLDARPVVAIPYIPPSASAGRSVGRARAAPARRGLSHATSAAQPHTTTSLRATTESPPVAKTQSAKRSRARASAAPTISPCTSEQSAPPVRAGKKKAPSAAEKRNTRTVGVAAAATPFGQQAPLAFEAEDGASATADAYAAAFLPPPPAVAPLVPSKRVGIASLARAATNNHFTHTDAATRALSAAEAAAAASVAVADDLALSDPTAVDTVIPTHRGAVLNQAEAAAPAAGIQTAPSKSRARSSRSNVNAAAHGMPTSAAHQPSLCRSATRCDSAESAPDLMPRFPTRATSLAPNALAAANRAWGVVPPVAPAPGVGGGAGTLAPPFTTASGALDVDALSRRCAESAGRLTDTIAGQEELAVGPDFGDHMRRAAERYAIEAVECAWASRSRAANADAAAVSAAMRRIFADVAHTLRMRVGAVIERHSRDIHAVIERYARDVGVAVGAVVGEVLDEAFQRAEAVEVGHVEVGQAAEPLHTVARESFKRVAPALPA